MYTCTELNSINQVGTFVFAAGMSRPCERHDPSKTTMIVKILKVMELSGSTKSSANPKKEWCLPRWTGKAEQERRINRTIKGYLG
jgi:hypothetical protein